MIDYQSSDNGISSKRYKDTDYIEKSSKKKRSHLLQILYFNKTGRFCAGHNNEVLQLGIILEQFTQIKKDGARI